MPGDGLNVSHGHTRIMHLSQRRAPETMGTDPL